VRVQTFRARGDRGTGLKPAQAVLIGLLVVAAVSLVSALVFVLSSGSNGAAASIIRPQPGSVAWNGRDRLNILLLGIGAPATTRRPTESAMLVSYDRASRSLSLLSLPGNLWVTVPGYGQARLADAYADGGGPLALSVAEGATNLVIPYYAALGSDATVQLIDAYGGVQIGRKHLTGQESLRYLSKSAGPTASMHREQRLFLSLLRQALQGQSLFQLPGVINAVGASIDTNLPYSQLPAIARDLTRVPRSHIRTRCITPGSGAASTYVTNGENVLLPDWQGIQSQVRPLVPGHSYAGRVDVLNGSTITGAATNLAAWFRTVGLRVNRVASARSLNYAHTQVVLNSVSRSRDVDLGHATAALLQAPLVTRAVRESKAPVVVIIGHDYQDPTQH
jgi:anionic cell wall polymer biosynthesis LytR-Cps2A-Psr (LCP) family protein